MKVQFYDQKTVLVALAVGGLIALAKDIVLGVTQLYEFALTPRGLAAIVVASVLVSLATLTIVVIKES